MMNRKFPDNRVLACIPAKESQRLRTLLEPVILRFGQILYEAGFAFDSGDAAKRSLQRYLANYSCPQRILVVARAGWYEDGDKTAGFMLPHGAVPFVEGYHLPILAPSARTARYSQRGTFEQWCDGAARLAGQHTLGVFRMSTALTLC